MANYSDLKAAIDVNIRNNGNGEITGDVLNQVLKNMVNVLGGGYQFAGAATTEMNPGTPDNNVYYVTTTAGTYTNFGGLVVNDGELALLTYNGNWQKVAVALPAGGGGGSTSGIEIRIITQGETDTEKQYNIETVALIKQGKAIPVMLNMGGEMSSVFYPQVFIDNDTNVMTINLNTWFPIGANSIVQIYVVGIGIINADGSYTQESIEDKVFRFVNEKILIQASDATQVKWLIDNYAELRVLNALPIPYLELSNYTHIFPVYMSVGEDEDYAAKIIYALDGLYRTFFYNAQGEPVKVEEESAGPYYKIETNIISPSTLELKPNRFYEVDVMSDTIITLGDRLTYSTTTKEYVIKIVCTGTPNITLPDGLIWANDTAPVFTAGKTYVISIIDNLAVFAEFTTAS